MKYIHKEFDYIYEGYRLVGVMNRMGFRCGYVGVTDKHPWYEKDYEDEGPNEVQCHWGLTYSGDGNHFDDMHAGWWYFGFDCGHYLDLADYDSAFKYGLVSEKDHKYLAWFNATAKDVTNDEDTPTIKTQEFVEEICKLIVEQLKRVERKSNDE